MPPDFSASGSGSGSGSGSAPAHSAIFTAHTSQEVFTAPGLAFLRTGADRRRLLGLAILHQCQEVRLVHLVQEVDGLRPLVIPGR